ncbi:MAG: hypothetical protein WD971_01705 [Pirellulales bacterium]
MKATLITIVGSIVFSCLLASAASAQPANDQSVQQLDGRVDQLESQVNRLRNDVRENVSTGGLGVLFGAFCALWAQNTGRNAWLWFFLGLIFSVFTVLVLSYKNSTDRRPV